MFLLGLISMFTLKQTNEFDEIERTETLETKPKNAPKGVTTRTFIHSAYIMERTCQKHYIERMLAEINSQK